MFPVSREKYNAAIAERDEIKDLLEATRAQLEEANASLDGATTRANDLSLEVQQLISLLDSDVNQVKINELTRQLADSNSQIQTINSELSTRNNELAQANERISELEQTVTTLKNTAVDPPAKAVTDNDAITSDHLSIVQFFQIHADDTDACVAKLRELGL